MKTQLRKYHEFWLILMLVVGNIGCCLIARNLWPMVALVFVIPIALNWRRRLKFERLAARPREAHPGDKDLERVLEVLS